MTTILSLTVAQLRRILALKEQIVKLHAEMDSIAAGSTLSHKAAKAGGATTGGKGRVAKTQSARRQKLKGKNPGAPVAKKTLLISPARRAKLAAAARARWAKVKAAGKAKPQSQP